MSLLSAAKNFLPLRGADRMAPCGAGNLFDGEARAKKWLQKCNLSGFATRFARDDRSDRKPLVTGIQMACRSFEC